jgi:hypothetical protein
MDIKYFKIIGFDNGLNLLSNKVCNFIVDCGGKPLKVKIGKNLSQVVKEHIWNNKSKWIGSEIKVGYKNVSLNGTPKKPKFLMFIVGK